MLHSRFLCRVLQEKDGIAYLVCIEVFNCSISECLVKNLFQGIASGLCVLNGVETVPVELTVGEDKLLRADRHVDITRDVPVLSLGLITTTNSTCAALNSSHNSVSRRSV